MRRELDYYPTPAWMVRRLLGGICLMSNSWVEPAAGEGHLIRAVNQVRPGVTWVAIEARAECRDALVEAVGDPARVLCPARVPVVDFPGRHGVCITNPPFGQALEFVRWGMEHAETTCLLMRLGMLASEERAEFMRTHAPDVLVLPNRASFTGDGQTDVHDLAWFVFDGQEVPRHQGRISVLPTTSAGERQADELELGRWAGKQMRLGLEVKA